MAILEAIALMGSHTLYNDRRPAEIGHMEELCIIEQETQGVSAIRPPSLMQNCLQWVQPWNEGHAGLAMAVYTGMAASHTAGQSSSGGVTATENRISIQMRLC